jgi:uncharacterized membrane protein YdjX (TVP38/TMEM64 family)
MPERGWPVGDSPALTKGVETTRIMDERQSSSPTAESRRRRLSVREERSITSTARATGERAERSGLARPAILLLILVTLIVLARSFDVGAYLGELREWIDSLGWLGPIAFILIYAVAVVAAVPGSAMTVIAGLIFGTWSGVIVVSIAATLGAGLSFLVSRYVAREPIARRLGQRAAFRRLDELTERHGATIVALTRLVPIFPFNLLNYGFGLTKVGFRTYLFWSWLCMLPGIVLYVVGADAVSTALSLGEVPWRLVAGVGVVAVFVAVLVRVARSKLQRKEREAPW